MTAKPRSFTGNEARQLLRRARIGTLATLNHEGGIPYASLVNVATDVGGQPIILVSTLAWHTRNLMADTRASLMVAEPPESGDALTGARTTVMGRFVRTDDPRIRRRYLARHPEAAMYAGFSDFALWRIDPESIHAVAGFGRIETLESLEVFPSSTEMEMLEESAIAHMNQDHSDAIQRFATVLLGAPAGSWSIASINTDGAILIAGKKVLWLQFPSPVDTAESLRACFAELGKRSRE